MTVATLQQSERDLSRIVFVVRQLCERQNTGGSTVTVGPVRAQRSATSSPITVGPTDEIINVNIATGTPSCTLPSAATRAGLPVTFVDVGGHAAAHNITITPFGGETISGLASVTLLQNHQVITLIPLNDGVNFGWYIS